MREVAIHPPSPLGAAAASALFPGWGQIRTGRKAIGSALVFSTAVIGLVTIMAVTIEGAAGVLAWLVDPEMLLVLVVLDGLVACMRVWATAHAWVIAGGRSIGLGLVTLVLLVAFPHVVIGYYGMETRSTLLSVFAPEPDPPVAEALPTTRPSTTTTTTEPTTTTSVPYQPLVPPMTIPTSTTTTTAPPVQERLTILLLGGDAGPGRPGLRTDTMIVASIDTATGDAALFGLPRNMGGFTFSDGTRFPGMSQGLLNEVYLWSWKHPGRFEGVDPGAAAVEDVAETLLGIPIDYFVLVDMVGFAQAVDAMGGVTVQVPRDIQAPLYDRDTGDYTMITIPQGSQALDGDHALAFARSRTGSNDYDRMGRQRCLLAALGDQTEPLRVFAHFPALLDMVEESVTTDIPLSKIPSMVNLASLLSPDRFVMVGFDRGYRAGHTAGGLSMPDVPKIQAAVQAALNGEAAHAGLANADETCT